MADTDHDGTITFTIESSDGTTDTLTIPAGLIDLFADGDETPPEVFGDIAVLSFAQQIHAAIHHGEGDVSDELRTIEKATMDLFEERYGVSFAEATGHAH